MVRPLVATDVVRFAGEIVAIVVSEDRVSGADAAELVMVDYDPLPVVLDRRGRREGRGAALPGARDERRRDGPARRSTTRTLFDGCDVVVSDTVWSQRMAAAPMEPRSAAAEFDDDGRLTVWGTSQTPHTDKMVLAGMLGLDPAQVRVDRARTSAAASARRCSRSRACSSPGSRASSARPCAGRRRAARTCSRSSTDARSASSSRSAGRGTARCSRTGSTSSPTPARTRCSAPSCRT